MNELLKNRRVDEVLIAMSDAHTCNLIDWLIAVSCKCLSHALRKFAEIDAFFSEECGVILTLMRQVYANEAVVKKEKMTDTHRLLYHQEHSKPLMDTLKLYLEVLIVEKRVEPNNSLGKAILYTLKHWHGLTRFLDVEGAPIDNNSMERELKVKIKARKNSLFYKTEFGAFVGSVLTSIIATAVKNDTNAFHYLESLYRHQTIVAKSPEDWLPWNYHTALQELSVKQKARSHALPYLQAA